MKRAILYTRVSRKDLEYQEFSLPAILKLLRQFAQRCELQIVKEFVDVEIGLDTGREQFAKMMRFLPENLKDDHIIVAERADSLIVRANGITPRRKRTYPQWQSFRDYLLNEWLVVVLKKDDFSAGRRKRTRRKIGKYPLRRSLRNYDWEG
jgi:hypothetical protein